MEKFQHFMLQDYLYLFDYAQIFALGVVKAWDSELMRIFAKNVDAILACSWSYAEIGQALIELMDKLAVDATEEQLAHLTDIFVNCSRYELGFWDMAWEVRL